MYSIIIEIYYHIMITHHTHTAHQKNETPKIACIFGQMRSLIKLISDMCAIILLLLLLLLSCFHTIFYIMDYYLLLMLAKSENLNGANIMRHFIQKLYPFYGLQSFPCLAKYNCQQHRFGLFY